MPRTKSLFYEKVKCSKCGIELNRKRGVRNPRCVSCKAKDDREAWRRKKAAIHMDGARSLPTLKATTPEG